MPAKLPPRHDALLRYVQGYLIASGGVSPSVRECARGIGRSVTLTQRLLDELADDGAIRRLPNRPRAIEVLTPVALASIDGAPLYAVPMPAGQGGPTFSSHQQDRSHAA